MILDVECTVKPWLGNATRMPSGGQCTFTLLKVVGLVSFASDSLLIASLRVCLHETRCYGPSCVLDLPL
jgi:hypothetical protein